MKAKPSDGKRNTEVVDSGIERNGNGSEGVASELETRIAWRAYELYEKRGRGDGHHLEDWFEAERQIGKEMEQQK